MRIFIENNLSQGSNLLHRGSNFTRGSKILHRRSKLLHRECNFEIGVKFITSGV
jgi:hypothetical protein